MKLSTNQKHMYLNFEKNMILMTFAITVAFLVRSSSLIGWVPLVIFQIMNTKSLLCSLYNLIAIIKATFLVAIPMIIFSVCLDSFYYGKFTFT